MRGRKSALTIALTPADRAEIEHWQRSTTGPAGLARRGRILLLLDQGETLNSTLAKSAGRSRGALATIDGDLRAIVRGDRPPWICHLRS